MPWLFDSDTQVWHMWPQPQPLDGDLAWCGYAKDADCSTQGGSDVPVKCEACLQAIIQANNGG